MVGLGKGRTWREATNGVLSGADIFVYDETTNAWKDRANASGALANPQEVLWTGKYALVRGQIEPYPLGDGPGPNSETTARYDPATNSWTAVAADVVVNPALLSAWTGQALFSYTDSSNGPSEASVYDPARDPWTQLPRPPTGCGGAPIWAGTQVLIVCVGLVPPSASGLAYTPGKGSPSTTSPAALQLPPRRLHLRPFALPALDQIPHAVPLYERRFPWGRGPGSVGGEPGHQSAPVGPLAFTADRDGNIVIFDVVNGRLVERLNGRATTYAVDTRGFDPEPAIPDGGASTDYDRWPGRPGQVFGTDGTPLRHFRRGTFLWAVRRGLLARHRGTHDVYADSDHSRAILLLHDDGTGYQLTSSATWEPDRVSVQVGHDAEDATIGRADGSRYSLRAVAHRRVARESVATRWHHRHHRSGRRTLEFRAQHPVAYYHLLIAIDRHGHAALQQFPAPNSYMDTGPIFELTDTYFGVMSDTEHDGVTIAVYPYPGTTGQ